MGNNIIELIERYLQSSSVFAYPIVLLSGILTSFTPCVYPIIPIIVGYIGGQKNRSRFSGFLLSCAYVLGMAWIYSALGAVAALSGKFFGQIQNTPMVNLIVAVIIIFFALSMLGLFSIPLPSFLNRSGEIKMRSDLGRAFLLGSASGFIAAPCTVPVLGVLLTFIAAKQNIFFGLSLLFTYALGLGFLLILAGTFTGLLTALPRSGIWMKRVQTFFGLFMLGLGIYFVFKAISLMLI